MHRFDYKERPRELLVPEIVNLLSALHEFKGKQEQYEESQSDVLTALLEVAKLQSTKASNRIEGIFTSDERLKAIVKQKATPLNRSEEEIAGYRDVLATIHESYEYINARPNNILQLHRDLYAFSHTSVGRKYKNRDNIIAGTDGKGNKTVRFVPVPAFLTSEAMENLCTNFSEAIQRECLFLAAWWISRSWQLGCAPTIGVKPTVDAPSAQLRLLLPDIPNLHVGGNTCDCS